MSKKNMLKQQSDQVPRQPGKTLRDYTFEEAHALKKESVWKNLADISVDHAVREWLATLKPITAKNYASGIKQLTERNLMNIELSLQAFSLLNHDAVIDQIKQIPKLSECSRQARAACYIAFTRFLARRTQGVIPKATPSREGTGKTFYRVRDKVATEAMTLMQWSNFLHALHKINTRDCLIAKIMLQGGKRMSEVLSLAIDKINFQSREITFLQSKTKGYIKETIITYPQPVIDELRAYVGSRIGLVFVTKHGQRVMPNQLSTTFAKAGEHAQIDFRVTPHVLRASAITHLKTSGFSDSDIMKISGHASSAMVNAYDKSDRAQNISKKVSLV